VFLREEVTPPTKDTRSEGLFGRDKGENKGVFRRRNAYLNPSQEKNDRMRSERTLGAK